MPVLSSILLVIALILAVVIGPQTRAWSWGPALVALGLAAAAMVPYWLRRGRAAGDLFLLGWGLALAGWFAWRAWASPVAELGHADLLLIGTAVAGFVSVRGVAEHERALRIFGWGVAALLMANLLVMGQQVLAPGFSPVLHARVGRLPTGFFAIYNEAANYLLASSLLLAGAAVFGGQARMTRIIWGALAVAGMVAVWFTRSRGGIFAGAVGLGTFAAMALVLGHRKKARWFAPALIALPVIGFGVVAFLIMGWQQAQASRFGGGSIEGLLDNDCRLYFLGAAISCIGLHPWVGGGSRSFSWECFQFLSGKEHGDVLTRRPEMVHNEWVQSATDYGLIGAGLLMGWVAIVVIRGLLRLSFGDASDRADRLDGWRLGAMAAIAGMAAQACFSFVFHMMIGALLLGCCWGLIAASPSALPAGHKRIGGGIMAATALAVALLLLPAGWLGSRCAWLVWPVYFSPQGERMDEAAIEPLTDALAVWPQATLYLKRGAIYQDLAGDPANATFVRNANLAIADYRAASQLHPHDPTPMVNMAHLLSGLERERDAGNAFERAVQLQGGMESSFRSHFLRALHEWRKARRPPHEHQLATLEFAAVEIESAVAQMHWITRDMLDPRVQIHTDLARARAAAGDFDGALAECDLVVKMPLGLRGHYAAGIVLGQRAVNAWGQRRSGDALRDFIAARQRVVQAGSEHGRTPSQRADYLAYLDQQIAFLKGAKVEPTQ